MRKLLCGVLIAFGLAACGGQEQQAPAVPEPASEASSELATNCPIPMGIVADKWMQNLDASFKATRMPTTIKNRNAEKEACGVSVNMSMERGEIKFLMDEKMGLLSVASGFELSNNLSTNTDRMFSTIQSIVALHGTVKWGASPLGKRLLEVIADTVQASKTQGDVINSFDMDGFTYLVACDGTSVAILARKQTP
ncbi:hypothetical protein A7P89_01360 [Eikenella corrodens]|uniref:Uncharacterized protein n=1 Tax=Eikenella corrodens TaxID=539 RepID=A0A1A9RTV6_EIKCO|nr:hypothetical protein [Eikenella corrodens]OAM24912.1 hypothetical protein A7P89_01360 [Eikenella corrodens]DAX46242.1 MAG TPA: lipoprotein [Caudoviricetes sp.]